VALPEQAEVFSHLLVRDAARSEDFRRSGGGNPKVRDVERRAHGRAMLDELAGSLGDQERRREEEQLTDEELRSLGVVVVLEGADPTYPLKLNSLQRFSGHRKIPKRPRWLLLSVTPAADGQPERAVVWISDAYRHRFLQLFERYVSETTEKGNPLNRELVANIARIRTAVLADLWQSAGDPPSGGRVWWELWLHPTDAASELLRGFADSRDLRLAPRVLKLSDRTVTWLHASWDELQPLPFTRVPLAEIRRPEFIDTIEDLDRDDQAELADDLLTRVTSSDDPTAPVVCHLDTGVRRTHTLLAGSLSAGDVHSIVDEFGVDERGHGTQMAGLSLYGPLDDLLLGTMPVVLRHRLESVKLLPDAGPGHDPLAYGIATAQAAAMPEAATTRRRVFSMPITTTPDGHDGEPTLWSASLDALASGVDIAQSDHGIELLGVPDPDAARLFVISAGNVRGHDPEVDYRDACDLSPAEDPAQAWNVLTVGAYTELIDVPTDPSFADWSPVGCRGDISPHSRTSVRFGRSWPIKPDICMEGGNVLTDGARDFEPGHPLLSLRTTDRRDDLALGSANATSAATAQAARLAALAYVRYPAYWPETIRGLMVHAAEWTAAMRAELDGSVSKEARLALLRRYGWGVPTENGVLDSSRQAVTTITQDAFIPFDEQHRARHFRLHRLPWPVQTLREIAAGSVTLRVTLSYFIEPTASRRGWRQRYTYPSHGLRFELKLPTETIDAFIARVNREAQLEEDGTPRRTSSGQDRWLIGPKQRNVGSLHQDIWEGSGAELADAGVIAVHPVGGWWKNNSRKDRAGIKIRYALIVSLKTAEQGIDLYTPIAAELRIPVENVVSGT
jgi:hypothetical protein